MDAREARYREAELRLWGSLGVSPTEQRVRLGHVGTTVRIQELGSGPPVLFVHGGSTCGTSWADLVARLDGFRCLLLDRPGTGLSDPLPAPITGLDGLGVLADSLVVDVLDALELDDGVTGGHLVRRLVRVPRGPRPPGARPGASSSSAGAPGRPCRACPR